MRLFEVNICFLPLMQTEVLCGIIDDFDFATRCFIVDSF